MSGSCFRTGFLFQEAGFLFQEELLLLNFWTNLRRTIEQHNNISSQESISALRSEENMQVVFGIDVLLPFVKFPFLANFPRSS